MHSKARDADEGQKMHYLIFQMLRANKLCMKKYLKA